MTRDELIEELFNCTGPGEAMQHIDRYVEDEQERIARAIEALIPDPHKEHETCADCWAVREAARIARAES